MDVSEPARGRRALQVQEQHAWGADFRASADTRKHLDAELESLRKILADLGVTASTQ